MGDEGVRGLGYTFLKKPTGIVKFVTWKKFSLLEILENFVTSLKHFKVKNQNSWKFHISTSGNSICFLKTPCNFHTCSSFNTSVNSLLSTPLPRPVLFFCVVVQYILFLLLKTLLHIYMKTWEKLSSLDSNFILMIFG